MSAGRKVTVTLTQAEASRLLLMAEGGEWLEGEPPGQRRISERALAKLRHQLGAVRWKT